MSRTLLPPRGIFVPTSVMYNHEYSPSVIHTWIQLRGLAWDRTETPPLSMNQLSGITGKSQSTLYGHLALLRSWGALRMRNSEKGTFILSFPVDTSEFFLDGNSIPDSKNLEMPDPSPSSQPNQIVSIDSEEREDFNPRQGDNQLDPSQGNGVQNFRQQSEFSDHI